MALLSECQFVRLGGKYTIQRCLDGLVLVEGVEVGTWRRVGAWKLKLRVAGIPVDGDNKAVVARRWREYRIVSDQWRNEDVILV